MTISVTARNQGANASLARMYAGSSLTPCGIGPANRRLSTVIKSSRKPQRAGNRLLRMATGPFSQVSAASAMAAWTAIAATAAPIAVATWRAVGLHRLGNRAEIAKFAAQFLVEGVFEAHDNCVAHRG